MVRLKMRWVVRVVVWSSTSCSKKVLCPFATRAKSWQESLRLMDHLHESIKSWLHLRKAYWASFFVTWALKCALTIFLSIKAETCQTSWSLITECLLQSCLFAVCFFSISVAYANASVLCLPGVRGFKKKGKKKKRKTNGTQHILVS